MTLATATALASAITTTVYHCDKARAWQGGSNVRLYLELDAISMSGAVAGPDGCPGTYLDATTGVIHFGRWKNSRTATAHMRPGGAVDQILELWAQHARPGSQTEPVYTMEERDGDEG